MTNKTDEIKALICTEQIKLLAHNILTPYLTNAVEKLNQLDLKTEKDELKIKGFDLVCSCLFDTLDKFIEVTDEEFDEILSLKQKIGELQ